MIDPLAPSGQTWAITTTDGHTVSGYLPDWAQEDPSKTGVAPDRLPIELSDMTHEASFGGQLIRVCPAAEDPGEDSAVFTALMQCSPFVEDNPEARVPLVNIRIFEDFWITNLDPSGVVEAAERFRDFADLLTNKVAPELSAARSAWAEHVSARNLRS
ncbi:DUF6907 domain-containing protein [Streptomyces sp. NBC_01190]|uniref:DUF6907 domain-containing protein n=1 Tax=Streptomyces sp. NBC_01190 TaxID=2903767 RepID=UPI0038642288